MELIDRIKQEFEVFNQKKKDLVEQLRQEFPNLLKPLFDQSKRIESIGWTQYTPYFNDGDTCEFGVNLDDFPINGISPWHLDWGNEYLEYGKDKKVNPNYDSKEAKIVEQIGDVLKSIPKDFYKDLFGDHVQVTIFKDGEVEVIDYDHD